MVQSVSYGQDGRSTTVRLRLVDPDSPDEYWLLDLARGSNIWRTKTGYKYLEGKQAFDLFKDEFLAGTKIMGSMKPYLDRALAAYSQGRDFRSAFAQTSPPPVRQTSTPAAALQFVGKWRYTDSARRATTTIVFKQDGTYYGNTLLNGRTSGFTGKWMLKGGILTYEYTGSSGTYIPIGTKDQDKVISITRDRYTIQNALGRRETYVRIE